MARLVVFSAAVVLTAGFIPTGTGVADEVATEIGVGGRGAVEADGQTMWVSDGRSDGAVYKIDSDTNEIEATVSVSSPLSLAVGFGSIWVASSPDLDTTLLRIDPDTAEITGQTILDNFGPNLAVGAGSVWVSDSSGRKVVRVDPATLETTATINVGWPSAITFGGESLWVANHQDMTVSRIDPATNSVTHTIELDIGPEGCCATAQSIAYGTEAVWVAVADEPNLGHVVRIDPATMQQVAVIEVGRIRGPGAHNDTIDASLSSVWVANAQDDNVSRIDVTTDEVAATVSVAGDPQAVEITEDAAWVGSFDTVSRIELLTFAFPVATVFDYPVGFGECAERPLSEYRVEQGADFLDEDYFELFGRHHSGEDWNRGGGTTDLGDPVCSIADGVVVESANFGGGWGNIVVVEHILPGGSSVWSQYAHLQERLVQRSDIVRRGERIGAIGEGCNADKSRCDYSGISHLHFEIRRVDVPADNPPGSSVEDAERIHDEYFDPTDIPTDSHPDKGFIEGNRFHDTSNSIFSSDIGWLSDGGITKGCNPPTNTRFCPDDFVTRGQMAAFLVRALGYTDDGGGDLFVDDDGSIFESDIDKLGTAGVTKGCNPPTNDQFCPDDFVTRGQMAAFLHRALDP